MIHYIDIHAHLDFPILANDVENIISEISKRGIKVNTNGIGQNSNRKALEIAKDENVYASLGIYPMDALDKREDFDPFEEIEFIREHKDAILAIGEVGLDYFHGGQTQDAKDEQIAVFREIIKLSKEIRKPMIIHSRKAENEVFDILEKEKVNRKLVILHCFSGKKTLVRRGLQNGWYFTIPSNVTRSESFQTMVKMIDINHLFCETDSPWLSPAGRFSINTPLNITESYRAISEIKGQDLEEVKKNIYMNFQQVFQ